MAAVLNNSHGVEVHLIPTGAVIQRLLLPDASGQVADVVLGFDTIEPYRDGTSPYFGAVVGRVANRIANATFELDGQRYELAANNGPNCLHGGVVGFSRVEWTVQGQGSDDSGQWLRMIYHSKDMEEVGAGTQSMHECMNTTHCMHTRWRKLADVLSGTALLAAEHTPLK